VTLHVRTFAAALLVGLAGGGSAVPGIAFGGERRVEIGDPVEDAELRTLDGKKEHFLQKGLAANVFIFFRTEHERSADALREMASCEKAFEKKPVRWVAIVSDSSPAEEVRAFVKAAGIRMQVLVDEGDALYGKLGIRLHPVIGMVDRKGKLAAFEPFRQLNYCERVKIRVKLLLGEATEADVAKVDQPESTPLPHSDQGVAKRHVNFARRLHDIKQDAAALAELDKAVAVFPNAGAFVLRGQILAAQGKCGAAVTAFDEALKIEPASTVASEGKSSCGK
jgi:tetratricopeptide (TPR) repeat protein